MFLIPIGHDELGVRRLPWITIGIALVCLAVQAHACSVDHDVQREVQPFAAELDRLTLELAEDCDRRPTCTLDDRDPIGSLTRAAEAGRVGDHLTRERYLALHGSLRALVERRTVVRFGLTPSDFGVVDLITGIFVHGGWMHLLGNMLFLYIVGLSIEDRWGRGRFLAFYLVGGVVASLCYAALHRDSSIPLVGASGAISAVMGAFLVLCARTTIRFFYFLWILIFVRTGTFGAPAWLVLPLWFVQQLLSVSEESSGASHVAYSAHAGGFLFGAVTALIIRFAGLDQAFRRDTDRAAGDWHEDPLFEQAQALVDAGDVPRARARLAQLLSADPGHRAGAELALSLADAAGDGRAVQRYAALCYPAWQEEEPRRILGHFPRLLELATSPVQVGLLESVLDAAVRFDDLDTGQQVARLAYHQPSARPLVPQVLWSLARIHARRGQSTQARGLVERLRRDHPTSPWASRGLGA